MTPMQIRERLEALPTKDVLAIYNAITKKDVKKFSSRVAGLRQTTKAMVDLDGDERQERVLRIHERNANSPKEAPVQKSLTEEDRLLADYGHVNCPGCGVHLSNGVNSDRQGHYECMACGHEWGVLKSVKRAESIAESWKDPNVAAKRAQRTAVRVDGVEYRSVRAAFIALGLPLSKHIRFRMALKAAGKAEFEGRVFEVVS